MLGVSSSTTTTTITTGRTPDDEGCLRIGDLLLCCWCCCCSNSDLLLRQQIECATGNDEQCQRQPRHCVWSTADELIQWMLQRDPKGAPGSEFAACNPQYLGDGCNRLLGERALPAQTLHHNPGAHRPGSKSPHQHAGQAMVAAVTPTFSSHNTRTPCRHLRVAPPPPHTLAGKQSA